MSNRVVKILLAGIVAVILAGCGGSAGGGSPDGGAGENRTVHVVLPLDQDGDDIGDWRAGMALALEEFGSGNEGVRIEAVVQNDSKPNGEEDVSRARSAATAAVADPRALAVVGPASSSATAAAAPVLNRADMLEVVMSSTAVSLTIRDDANPGPPPDVAPTGRRTIVRVVPNDEVQARALVDYLREEGIRRAAVVDDGGRFGTGLASGVIADARGEAPLVERGGTSDRGSVAALARRIAVENAPKPGRWALILAVNDQEMALRAAKAVQEVDSSAAIVGPDSLARRAFLAGVEAFERSTYLVSFELPARYYGPEGERVTEILRGRLGREPGAGSLFAYEAMALAISAIDEAYGVEGFRDKPLRSQRRAVADAALKTRDRGSVIGTYSIGVTGDTSTTLFGAYRVEDGVLVRGRAVDTKDIE